VIRLHPLVAIGALTLCLGPAGAFASVDRGGRGLHAHELGWLCLSVSDTRVAQISAFNKDAADLSIWVTKERFHVEREGDGPHGRICVPTIVRVGQAEIPDNTLIFEREVRVGEVVRSAAAELVLVPELATLAEATVAVRGLADQWTERDGVWTFQVASPVRFAERVTRGLSGDGDGPSPVEVFRSAAAMERFSEPCRPFVLTEAAVGNVGVFDRATGRVSPRGIEPFRLPQGEIVSRCQGLSADGTMIAVARRLGEGEGRHIGWFLLPRESGMAPKDDATRFTAEHPFGGYHVCRQPTWNSATIDEVRLAAAWELLANGEWLRLTGEHRDRGLIEPGTPVVLLDHRDGWALVRVTLDGVRRTLALPGRVIAMPSGPASEVRSLAGGLCQWPRGEWRALKAPSRPFRVAQDTPGSELSGNWLEIPEGSRVLVMCQGPRGCDPVYVGGAQVKETERVRLMRYGGYLLGIYERDLRERTTGTFDARVERPHYHPGDDGILRQAEPRWALGLGPGARLSFARQDDFAWAARVRLQELDPKLGFEGAIGVGGDGHGTFMELTGGVGVLLHRFEDAPIELRAAGLAKVDLRFAGGGGLGVDLIAKGQLRWVNDFAPVSFEIGVNVGFGGTFASGDEDGRSGVTFGMPLWLHVELIQF